jgi:pyruvate/2-oxoglutarate dehydrogenase complex dihydrolipoamide dehydrogenase (E3) component
MVRGLNEMYLENYKKTRAEFVLGSGRFLAPRTVEVALADGTTREPRGTNVIVSTGTRAKLEAIPGLSDAQPLTHIEALELDTIPKHLLIIGSGYVGVEFAQAMRRFGSTVSVIGRTERLMPQEDQDVGEALRRLLEDEGVNLLLKTRIKRVSEGREARLASKSSKMELKELWMAVTCWWLQGGLRIPRDSAWSWLAWN